MKIEVEDLSPVRKSLAVEVEPDVVERETEEVLRRFASQVRIPGFREGKAPRNLVRSRFARQIDDDVRDRLMARLWTEATAARGLRPLGEPVVEEVVHHPGQPFRFKTSFEVLPEFSPRSYRGVEARQPAVVVEAAEVDGLLEELRQGQARLKTEEGRAAQNGDVVVVDIEGRPSGGGPFRRERALVEVGGSQLPDAVSASLLGATAGADVTAEASRPGAGDGPPETVAYSMHVHEVKRRIVPPLDDELAKDLGDFESLAALTERVRQDLVERKQRAAEQSARQGVLDKVLLENPIPLPDHLVHDEMRHRMEDMARSLVYQGVDPNKLEVDWVELGRRQEEPARKTVHARLLLDAVAAVEGVGVSDEEVAARVRREAERMGEKAAAVEARLREGGGWQALTSQMVREKTLDFLIAVANIQREE